MTTAAVFGTGSWGTAYAMVLADAGTTVRMWGRRQEMVDQINSGCNQAYLPGVTLPGLITAAADPSEVAAGADIVVPRGPEPDPARQSGEWGSALPTDAAIVSLMKGSNSARPSG